MEAQRASRSGRRPGFAVAVLILGLIALILGALLFFQLLTVEQFFAALILAFILALGIIFTIRARGAGGKALAVVGTLILLGVVAGGILFSGLPVLQGEASAPPTATVNPGTGVTPTGLPGAEPTPPPTFAAHPGAVDFTLAEFGVSLISMVAGILSVIVSVIALFAARAANRPPPASGS
jgi:uncharacterized membrane protein HdeD (DUF308 family)